MNDNKVKGCQKGEHYSKETNKKIYQKWWFWLCIILIMLIAIIIIFIFQKSKNTKYNNITKLYNELREIYPETMMSISKGDKNKILLIDFTECNQKTDPKKAREIIERNKNNLSENLSEIKIFYPIKTDNYSNLGIIRISFPNMALNSNKLYVDNDLFEEMKGAYEDLIFYYEKTNY